MATAAAIPTISYRDFGPVETLEESGSLTKIRTDNDAEFWVPTAKLKHSRVRPENVPPPALVVSDDISIAKFIHHLNSTGYVLRVDCREDGLATAEVEYMEWSNEELPAESVRHYENKPLAREWRLTFDLKGLHECPFPVTIMGTSGNRPSKQARILMYDNGRAECYYAVIIERLVRAGLRIS